MKEKILQKLAETSPETQKAIRKKWGVRAALHKLLSSATISGTKTD